jgi:hypothetical protein
MLSVLSKSPRTAAEGLNYTFCFESPVRRRHISLHLSKADAEARAMELARRFMNSQDTSGWAWTIDFARADPINPDHKGRKIATGWIVIVNYTKDGAVLDGPTVLYVNIEDGSVAFDRSR